MNSQNPHKTIWNFSNRREELYYYLGFAIWPFGIMLASLKNWQHPWSKNVFWFFCLFFGYTFVIAADSMNAADSAAYAQALGKYAYSDLTFRQLTQTFYSESTNYVDIIQPLITFLVSRVTYNPSILFAVYGLIFGFFYSRNLWYVLDKIEGNITPVLFLFLLTFGLLNPIWNINGVRMWTAAQIFLYGTLPYLLDGNRKRLIWSGVSILMHFSFIFPCGILLLFLLIKNRLNFFMGFFVLTSFLKELDLEMVRSSLSFLPGIFQLRVNSYTGAEYAELVGSRAESYNWYKIYSLEALVWVTYAIVVYAYIFFRRHLSNNRPLMTLFCYSLLLYGASNIFSLVPSGKRFLIVATAFLFSFFILFFNEMLKNRFFRTVSLLSVPLLALFCIVAVRTGMDFFGLNTLIGNPVSAFIFTDSTPLIEVIKRLL